MGNLKKIIEMNLFTKQPPDTENKLTAAKGERGGGGYIKSLGFTDTH